MNISDSNGVIDPAKSVGILSDKALATWEIISVVTSILLAEWVLGSAAGLSRSFAVVPVVLALTLMMFSHRVREESLREIGCRFDNFLRCLYLLALPVLAVAVLMLIAGWLLYAKLDFFRWHSRRYLLVQLLLGFAWGLAQQYAIQGFFNRRAMLVAGRGWISILLVATVFGGLHLPNLWLAGITFIGGAVWAAIYQRVPNLFALAISHAVMTWILVSTLPPPALHHLRVGLGYFG